MAEWHEGLSPISERNFYADTAGNIMTLMKGEYWLECNDCLPAPPFTVIEYQKDSTRAEASPPEFLNSLSLLPGSKVGEKIESNHMVTDLSDSTVNTARFLALIDINPKADTSYLLHGNSGDKLELSAVSQFDGFVFWRRAEYSADLGVLQQNGPNALFTPSRAGKTIFELCFGPVAKVKVIATREVEVLKFVRRSEWGADQPTISQLTVVPDPDRITFHHTASEYSFSNSEVKRIQKLHMGNRWYGKPWDAHEKWADIGYHYLIDFKTYSVFEGRWVEVPSGITINDKNERPQSSGFVLGSDVKLRNTAAGVGVAIMGNLNDEYFSTPLTEGGGNFPYIQKVGLALCHRHKIDPSASSLAKITVPDPGNGPNATREDTVRFPSISNHAEIANINPVNSTECPGTKLRNFFAKLRKAIIQKY